MFRPQTLHRPPRYSLLFLCSMVATALLGCHFSDAAPTGPPPTIITGLPLPPAAAKVPAFPGAEGWGATALNKSRDLPLKVHLVSSRAGSGPGTLAEAIQRASDHTYDIIIFRTGGKFEPPDPVNGGLSITARHVYIAGQTAPGGGVMIDGGGTGTTLHLRAGGESLSDVVVRYIRVTNPRIGISIHAGERIVIDHVSIGWSRRYPIQISRRDASSSEAISSVVIQNSVLHNALDVHPTSLTMNHAGREARPIGMSDISVHRNLFANNDRRNPRTGADNTLMANNVIYNWSLSAMDAESGGIHDFVNNFGKHGPMSRPSHVHLVTPRCDEAHAAFSIFAAGNVSPASSDPTGDNWFGSTRQVACQHTSGGVAGAEPPSEWRRVQPQAWQLIPFPVNVMPARESYEWVLANAGASASLACDGTWIPTRDFVDRAVVAEVENGTGPSEAPSGPNFDSGVNAGVPCADSDADGLPDAWETRFFGCATCADPAARGREGYLVLEHYLNGTVPH